jgi:hypothetical protein
MGQGSQANLSLPPSCFGCQRIKHSNKAHLKVWVSRERNRCGGEAARATESDTGPKLSKVLHGDVKSDGRESLGQAVGAQGVLIQPECFRGCSIPKFCSHATVASTTCGESVERLTCMSQVPRGLIVTASKASAPQKLPNLFLKRPRSNPVKPTHASIRESGRTAARVGSRCWSGRRPGGTVLPERSGVASRP